MKLNEQKPCPDRRRGRRQRQVLLAKTLAKAAVLAAVLWLLFFRVFSVHRITDDTLEPVLKDGDLAVTWELGGSREDSGSPKQSSTKRSGREQTGREKNDPEQTGPETVSPERIVFIFRPRSMT